MPSLALASDDLRRVADRLRPVHERTDGIEGWVSPLLAPDAASTLKVARELFSRAARPNLHIKDLAQRKGSRPSRRPPFAGIPVNVTLLFSREQYLAAADALRGVERRIEAGLDPAVRSVGSVFGSRWDVAVALKVPQP